LGGNVIMVPKETDSTFDIKRDVIGTGPFVLSKYTPSVGLTYTRHPDFYDKNVGFIDGIETAIVPEYAAGLSQFTAGNIYLYGVRASDVIDVKKQAPVLNLYQTPVATPTQCLMFGWLPEGKSPFLDER